MKDDFIRLSNTAVLQNSVEIFGLRFTKTEPDGKLIIQLREDMDELNIEVRTDGRNTPVNMFVTKIT